MTTTTLAETSVTPSPFSSLTQPFNTDVLHWMVKVQEEERQAIGRQLRDDIGQVLTCCKLLLETKHHQMNEMKIAELVSKHLQQTIHNIMHLSYQLTGQLQVKDKAGINGL